MSQSTSEFDGDQPILKPEHDRLGFGAFVDSLSDSIRMVNVRNGYVIAVCGPWGRGKTSILNLVEHNLTHEGGFVEVQKFSCLYAQSDWTIFEQFLSKIYSFLPKKEKGQVLKKFKTVGSSLSSFVDTAPIISVSSALISSEPHLAAAGFSVKTILNWLPKFRGERVSPEDAIKFIREKFKEQQDKKFVLIIDDIDRLPPGKIINVFRLVKTLGDMPNLVTILAYDNEIVRNLVGQDYQAEGEVFMDKMVQKIVHVPPLARDRLRILIVDTMVDIFQWGSEPNEFRFYELIDLLESVLGNLRDIKRWQNALLLSASNGGRDLNSYDIALVEALKVLSRPEYNFIREYGIKFSYGAMVANEAVKLFMDELRDFLGGQESEMQKREARQIFNFLFPLFPHFDVDKFEHTNFAAVNDNYNPEEMRIDRRIQSPECFNTYFSLELPETVLTKAQAEELLSLSENENALIDFLKREIKQPRRKNYLDLLLDELRYIPRRSGYRLNEHGQNIINTIFCLGDELIQHYETVHSMTHIDSYKNLFWVISAQLEGVTAIEEKDKIFSAAFNRAAHLSPLWFLIFSNTAREQHFPDKDNQKSFENEWFMSEGVTLKTFSEALNRLRKPDMRLLEIDSSLNWFVLLIWSHGGVNDEEIRSWANSKLTQDSFIALMANTFSLPRVGNGKITYQSELPKHWIDTDAFISRARRLVNTANSLEDAEIEAILTYLDYLDNPVNLFGER